MEYRKGWKEGRHRGGGARFVQSGERRLWREGEGEVGSYLAPPLWGVNIDMKVRLCITKCKQYAKQSHVKRQISKMHGLTFKEDVNM
jgi:hypothetical protein